MEEKVFESFEVWCNAAPNRPLIVAEIDGQIEKCKIVVWDEYRSKMGEKGWSIASCSVFPDLRATIPGPGWLRLYAIFEREVPKSPLF